MTDEQKTIVRSTPNTGTGTGDSVGIAGFGTSNATNVIAIGWGWMLLVRISRMYLQTFFGLLGADGLGIIDIHVPDAAWNRLAIVAYAASAPTLVSLGQNLLEYLTKIDVRAPVFRG